MLLYIGCIAISVWLLFFGGAEKLEQTVVGYFDFGNIADKALYIRISAWASIFLCVVFLLNDIVV
ncbi:MAG: hypothetical protein CMN84_00745 [Spongiibacteraceae bacterium]|jgi:hypothetical protein|nr:hypothetical protein [Spongiibacteraceae bacterium]